MLASLWLCLVLVESLALSAQPAPIRSTLGRPEALETYQTGLSLVRQGHLDEAIASFERGLRVDPQSAVLWNVIGATYSLKGDLKRAQDYFRKSLQVDSGFLPARKNLALTYFESGKYDLAETEFRQLVDTPGDSRSVAFVFLGIIAETNGEFDKSASLLAQAGDLVHKYPQAVISFAHSLFELRQPEKADGILSALENVPGVRAPEYFKAGLLYAKQERYAQALVEFDRAKTINPRLSRLDYQRAVVLRQLGHLDEALKGLESLIRTNPDADSLNLLAHIAKETGNPNLAIQSLRQAAELEPGKEVNYLDFSTLCLDYENYPLALEAAEIGLEHLPNSYRLLVQKGAILEKLGRFGDAEKIVLQATHLEQDNSVALLSLAIIQMHAGELQEAIDTLSSALTKFSTNYQMHYYRGIALEQLSEHDPTGGEVNAKAEQSFRETIRWNPSFADAYYHLSKLYARNNPKLAEENLRTCLRLDPQHGSAEYSLGRLYLRTGRRAEGLALIDRFERHQQAEKLKEQQKPRLDAAHG